MTKKQARIAKVLFKKSLNQKGLLDSARVRQILSAIVRDKPRGISPILKAYRRLCQSQLKAEEVDVETSQVVKTKQLQKLILKKTGARQVNFKINPDMVLGAKITHGNWVWDATLDAKLEQLTSDSGSDSSYR